MTEYAWIDANNNVRLKGTPDPAISASTPGAARVLGPFPFAFDTPSIENGVSFYTPTVGDILLDAWIKVDSAFDGTTPFADIGTFDGQNTGMWYSTNGLVVDLSRVDQLSTTDPHLYSSNSVPDANSNILSANTFYSAALHYERYLPGVWEAANPLLVVVSQNGQKGGTAVGGTTGAGNVYLVVATPSLT